MSLENEYKLVGWTVIGDGCILRRIRYMKMSLRCVSDQPRRSCDFRASPPVLGSGKMYCTETSLKDEVMTSVCVWPGLRIETYWNTETAPSLEDGLGDQHLAVEISHTEQEHTCFLDDNVRI